MGRKKGGAKNKLARMSEEERVRYLQHRADMEEEARRRKQQLIALYMKNKLKREEAFCRLNLAKINEEWRSILRQVKCQELKNELVEVERLFVESLEQKDQIIRRLLNDLDEAEDLYSTLQQSHMQDVERVIDIQDQRMRFLKEWFCKERDTILNEWKEDQEKYKEGRDRSQVELECVFYGLEELAEKRMKDKNEDHMNKLDNLRSSMAIKLEEITKSREELLEQLWNEYQKVLDDYMKYTESFYVEYCELRERDDENTKLIRTHCYEIAKATEQIAELKLEAETVEEESEFQISYLKNNRKDLNESFFQRKIELEKMISSDEDKFKFMIVNSHKSIKFLEKMAKKGETLVQLAATCRKLETEREKILPFGLNNTHKPKLLERSISELKTPPDELKKSTIGIWLNLENFWIRVNNVRLDVGCLKEEKSFLEQENTKLKRRLKDYLTTVTLNSGNNATAEDHLQKRPHSMKIEKIIHIDLSTGKSFPKKKIKRRPVTCVEGNLSNAIRTAKLVENKMSTAQMPQIRTIVNW